MSTPIIDHIFRCLRGCCVFSMSKMYDIMHYMQKLFVIDIKKVKPHVIKVADSPIITNLACFFKEYETT